MRLRIPVIKYRLCWPIIARCALLCATAVACFPAAVSFAQPPPKAAAPLEPVQKLIADLDAVFERSTDRDQVIVDDSNRLLGEVVGKSLTVATRFGELKVSLDEIAAVRGMAGGAAGATWPRIFLRSGEIYSGRIVAGDLRLVAESGIDMQLSFDQLAAVVMRSAASEKKLEAPAVALITTLRGDRLAVAATPGATLQFATPWSTAAVAVDEIHQLTAVEEPQPAFRLETTAGDQLTILAKTRELTLNATQFDSVRVAVGSIRRWQAVDPHLSPDLFPARLHLSEGNTLMGSITPGAIHLTTAAGDVTVPSDNIASIAPQADTAGTIQIRLKQGETVVGRCIEPTLVFQALDATWHVPLRHVQGFQSPGWTPEEASTEPAPAPNGAPGAASQERRLSPKPDDLFGDPVADPFGAAAAPASDPFAIDPFRSRVVPAPNPFGGDPFKY